MTGLLTRWFCTALFLALLAVNETVMVHVLVLPYNSGRADWLLTTLVLAPIAAYAQLFAVMLAGRLAADFAAGIRRIGDG